MPVNNRTDMNDATFVTVSGSSPDDVHILYGYIPSVSYIDDSLSVYERGLQFYKRYFDANEWKRWKHKIDRVIFNDPATIILWKSGEKTVVKCGPDEQFDKEKGLAMALCKYVLGNKGNYNRFFKAFMKEGK